MFISGVLCVWQFSAGDAEPQSSCVSVFPDCEEALSPCWSCWDGILRVACWDASVSAAVIQTASNQLHQVKYFLSFFPSMAAQRHSFAYCNFTCFLQTFDCVNRGVRHHVAGLLSWYKAEPDADKRWPRTSQSHSECAEEETSASCRGNHRWTN